MIFVYLEISTNICARTISSPQLAIVYIKRVVTVVFASVFFTRWLVCPGFFLNYVFEKAFTNNFAICRNLILRAYNKSGHRTEVIT